MHNVRAQRIAYITDVCSRLDLIEIELLNCRYMVKDRRELSGRRIELILV